MPKASVVKFTLNIAASGHGFTEEFTIKEGDLLSILAISEATKYEIANLINQGYEVYVPQEPLDYMEWTDGENYFAYNPADYSNMWMMRGKIWGGQTVISVEDWLPEYKHLFQEGCETVSIIPKILEPAEGTVYYKGEVFTMKVKFTVTMLCPKPDGGYEEITEDIYEDFSINTAEIPPSHHTLVAQGYKVPDAKIKIWVIEFDIEPQWSTRYFTIFGGESYPNSNKAKIWGRVLPNNFPVDLCKEIALTVWKEQSLIAGPIVKTFPIVLSIEWDGFINETEIVDFLQNPFEAQMSATFYRRWLSPDVVTTYSYRYPCKVYFQKMGDYDMDDIPNWYEYWSHFLHPPCTFGYAEIPYAGQYHFIEFIDPPQNTQWVMKDAIHLGPECPNKHEIGDPLAVPPRFPRYPDIPPCYGIHSFNMVYFHERIHRYVIYEWWWNNGNYDRGNDNEPDRVPDDWEDDPNGGQIYGFSSQRNDLNNRNSLNYQHYYWCEPSEKVYWESNHHRTFDHIDWSNPGQKTEPKDGEEIEEGGKMRQLAPLLISLSLVTNVCDSSSQKPQTPLTKAFSFSNRDRPVAEQIKRAYEEENIQDLHEIIINDTLNIHLRTFAIYAVGKVSDKRSLPVLEEIHARGELYWNNLYDNDGQIMFKETEVSLFKIRTKDLPLDEKIERMMKKVRATTGGLCPLEQEAIAELGSDVVPILCSYIENDTSDRVRMFALFTLGIVGDTSCIDPIYSLIIDPNETDDAKRVAIDALSQINTPETILRLLELLNHGRETSYFLQIILRLGQLQDTSSTLHLLKFANSSDAKVRSLLTYAFYKTQDPRSVDFLRSVLGDTNAITVIEAALTLGKIGDTNAIPIIKGLLNDKRVIEVGPPVEYDSGFVYSVAIASWLALKQMNINAPKPDLSMPEYLKRIIDTEFSIEKQKDKY